MNPAEIIPVEPDAVHTAEGSHWSVLHRFPARIYYLYPLR